MEVEEISQEDFQEMAQNWLTANRKKVGFKTTGRRLTSLKAFAKWAGWGAMLSDYSAPTPVRGKPHPLPEGIDGVKRMIAYAHTDRHAALVALCGLCGLRVSEALGVRASHFDLDEMTLTVYGKGEKERIVPVSNVAWEIIQIPVIRSFVSEDAPVVGLRDRYARAIITRLAVKAGLRRHVSSHDLRATFATADFDKTLDQKLVQDLLGHAYGSTTELYLGRSMHQFRNGVEL
jgi:integrase